MYKTAHLYLLHNGERKLLCLLLCSAHNLWFISNTSFWYDTSENNDQRKVRVWKGTGHLTLTLTLKQQNSHLNLNHAILHHFHPHHCPNRIPVTFYKLLLSYTFYGTFY